MKQTKLLLSFRFFLALIETFTPSGLHAYGRHCRFFRFAIALQRLPTLRTAPTTGGFRPYRPDGRDDIIEIKSEAPPPNREKERAMKRRTLDFIVSGAMLTLAALLALGGLFLTQDANFAKTYVRDQLVEEKLEFPTADKLVQREKEFTESRTGCVIANAGRTITTGKQAECYANEYLGGHLTWLATRLGMTQVAYVDGMRYRELGVEQGNIRTQIAAAKQSNPTGVATLEQKLTDVGTVRTKMFEGTMLRNALLTTYGFSVLGERAGQAATVAFFAVGILALMGTAELVHALITPKSRAFAPVEIPEATKVGGKPALV